MKKIATLLFALLCTISLSAQSDGSKSKNTAQKPKTEKTTGEKPTDEKPKGEKPKSEKPVNPKKVKEPMIEFEKTEHDYGTVTKGGNGECEFRFKNTGKADLVLSNVRSSCGCTVPSWPKEPIPPKGTAVIKVKYDTNRVGPINKTVTVESNASNTSKVQLKIKGNVANKPAEKAPENNSSSLANPNQ